MFPGDQEGIARTLEVFKESQDNSLTGKPLV
jgi:hypothetical protein